MRTTKIRTAMIALATTFAVTGAAAVPAGSQAMGIKLVTRPYRLVQVCHEETILTPYGFATREVCETKTEYL